MTNAELSGLPIEVRNAVDAQGSTGMTNIQEVNISDTQTQFGIARIPLRRLLLSSLKIGATGFGGGMAIVALMEDEIVTKLKAMSSEEFVTGIGLSQFLGAFPVNTALFIGCRLYGFAGALLSAATFLLPSVSLVILLSALYFKFHTLPALDGVMRAVNTVVIALIVSAAWSLGKRVVHSLRGLAIATAAFIASVLHVHPVMILLIAAIIGLVLAERVGDVGAPREHHPAQSRGLASLIPLFGKISALGATFLKAGLFFFGGGFALIPLLQALIVRQHHWLSPKEFLDGLAISSLTPGPIAVIATFVGYREAGVVGALTSTIALFLPGTILMIWISRGYAKFRHSKSLHRVLAGVNPATIGLVLSAGVTLGRGSLTSWAAVFLSLSSLVLLTRLKWPPPVVLGLGAIVGLLGVV
jgi:chromate transporter